MLDIFAWKMPKMLAINVMPIEYSINGLTIDPWPYWAFVAYVLNIFSHCFLGLDIFCWAGLLLWKLLYCMVKEEGETSST